MTNYHVPFQLHSFQSSTSPCYSTLLFVPPSGLCPYKSFGAALLKRHWVLLSTAVNSARPFLRWLFFLFSTLLPQCHKFCSGALGASAVSCQLGQPLLALVIFSAIRRVLLALLLSLYTILSRCFPTLMSKASHLAQFPATVLVFIILCITSPASQRQYLQKG